MFELSRPLVLIDLETTGTFPDHDRIIEIALIKLYPDGHSTNWQTYINPGFHIPVEATEIHHITDEMVANASSFKDVAPWLATGLKDCDYAGFNVRFDLRMLKAEFMRCGVPLVAGLLDGRVVDAYQIFTRYEPRTLEAAVKFYLGREHTGAHSAAEDIGATYEVMEKQLERYGLPRKVDELADFLEQAKPGAVDPEGRFIWRDGHIVLNFGKHAGTRLADVDRGFLQWILKNDFGPTVKEIVRQALAGIYPSKTP